MADEAAGQTMFEDARWMRIKDDGFVGLVGPIYEWQPESEAGRFGFLPTNRHRNRIGHVQGGMLMTFADRAMGATARRGDPDRVHVTVQFGMQFMRPARVGAPIEIEARVVRETSRLSFVEARLTSGEGLIAQATGLWSILQRGTTN